MQNQKPRSRTSIIATPRGESEASCATAATLALASSETTPTSVRQPLPTSAADPGDEHAAPVEHTRRGREVHILPWKGGWKIVIEGGGTQPFANHHFTRWELARGVVQRWKQENE